MKIHIKYLLIVTSIMLSNFSFSQEKKTQQVNIGEQMPNIAVSGWLDDSSKIIKMPNLYKNKLLILDFWATWCGACIEETPIMDSLKMIFGNKVDFVVVCYESKITINKFFKIHPEDKPKFLSILTGNKNLSILFPHRAIPHEVWINSKGKVIAITSSADVTAKNISKVLMNDSLKVEEKSEIKDFDFRKPFRLRDSTYTARSIFTTRTKGILSYSGGTGIGDRSRFLIRIMETNASIKRLYWEAVFHREICDDNYDRLILEVKDSLKYMPPKQAYQSYKRSKYFDPTTTQSVAWENDNLYCYELQVPVPQIDSVLYKHMVNDLNLYLNLNGRWQVRSHTCYILTYKKDKTHLLIPSHQSSEIIYDAKYPVWTLNMPVALHHQNVSTLIEFLNMSINHDQILNATGIRKDAMFDFDLRGLGKGITYDQVNSMLAKYGLILKKGIRKVPLFIVSEN